MLIGETDEIETEKTVEKISETKSWLLINKFDKLLARLMRKKKKAYS